MGATQEKYDPIRKIAEELKIKEAKVKAACADLLDRIAQVVSGTTLYLDLEAILYTAVEHTRLPGDYRLVLKNAGEEEDEGPFTHDSNFGTSIVCFSLDGTEQYTVGIQRESTRSLGLWLFVSAKSVSKA